MSVKQLDTRDVKLRVTEIFSSVQGESSRVGLPTVFVRLTGCPLRCVWCDSAYPFTGGEKMSLADVMERVASYGCRLVEVTGGEPLNQKRVHEMMSRLCDRGRMVLLETSGACDISTCDPRVIRIMDLKTPGSGECARNLWSNIPHLTKRDEVKCVIGSREDYEWSRDRVRGYDPAGRCGTVLFSPIFGRIEPRRVGDVSNQRAREGATGEVACDGMEAVLVTIEHHERTGIERRDLPAQF